MRLPYPRCQRFLLRGFRFRSSIYINSGGFLLVASLLVTLACGRHQSVQPREKKPLVPRVIWGGIVKNIRLLWLSLVNNSCVLPVYSFSSMSQHQMRRISLMHTTKISSSSLGLIGFYTICPGKNDKFNDVHSHNSSPSHHCDVHIIMKQSETYSPRS